MIEHFLNAEKEILINLKSLIDAKIETLEKKDVKKPGRKKSNLGEKEWEREGNKKILRMIPAI